MSITKVKKAIRDKYLSAGTHPAGVQGSYAEGSSALPVTYVRHEVMLGGDTGIVATQFGGHNMGITVGRLRTGVYGIAFPDAAHVSIMSDVYVPTGAVCQVNIGGLSGMGRVVGPTGLAEMTVKGLTGGTPINPSTGTVVTLDFMFSGKFPNDKTTLVPY
jgi:hypothetical protein